MINGMYGINLTSSWHCEAGDRVGPAPALGLPHGWSDVAIIARCTLLLTGAPLELNHDETQNNKEHSVSLAINQNSKAIAHFL